MKTVFRNNRGTALVLTILIISLIVALTLQFNRSMRSDLQETANFRDGIKLGYVAKSGFNYALAVLLKDASEGNVDSLQEVWTDTKALAENTASLFEESRINIKILDHSGRIQINRLVDQNGQYDAAQKALLTRFLNSPAFGLTAEETDNIVDAIKDWIDADSEETRFGAENAYYQTLEKPYSCKNAPLEFIEELLLVRGITKEVFYGNEEKPGISDYLSAHGDGKININTADPLLLKALSEDMDDGMVEDMISYRGEKESDLSDPTWYKQLPGMGDVNIPNEVLTTSSTYFEVVSEGFKDEMSKRVLGMVKRTEGELDILSWKIE
jgi:general secretion pathway protein K